MAKRRVIRRRRFKKKRFNKSRRPVRRPDGIISRKVRAIVPFPAVGNVCAREIVWGDGVTAAGGGMITLVDQSEFLAFNQMFMQYRVKGCKMVYTPHV